MCEVGRKRAQREMRLNLVYMPTNSLCIYCVVPTNDLMENLNTYTMNDGSDKLEIPMNGVLFTYIDERCVVHLYQ